MINTVIGGHNGDGQSATNAIVDPVGMEAYGAPVAHLYISDGANNRIRRVNSTTGIISTVAGNGESGFSGDGGSALNAALGSPADVAFDSAGNMYISESFNRRVRRVDLAGNIQTVAGNGDFVYQGDNVPATQSAIDPRGIAVDTANNLYIADIGNHRVRKVSPQGTITTVAGTGATGYSGDGGPASQAALASPTDVWVNNNNLYIADFQAAVIRKVDSSGIITTVAGSGLSGFAGDNGPAVLARLNRPYCIATDIIGNLFMVDSNNYRVRRVDALTQFINTIAGNGSIAASGDGGLAINAGIFSPVGVAVDPTGNVYVGSRLTTSEAWSKDDRVRKIAPSGIISTYAGITHNGDGGPASMAIIDPYGIRFGKGSFANDLYITDGRNNQIRRVSGATGVITTLAGNGTSGFSGDNGPAINATLKAPRGVASDASGNVWIADTNNHRVRKVDTGGTIRTVAGNGTTGYGGDGVNATTTSVYFPHAVDVDAAGNLYIADRFNNRIRKVTPGGTISTIAGTGAGGSTGNDGPATLAAVAAPTDVLVAADGSIYIAEPSTNQVRKITPAGIMMRVAGTGVAGYMGDEGPALNARLSAPFVITLDSNGNLFIGEQGNVRVRRVDAVSGIITTVAGTGTSGSTGDGGPATAAQLLAPTGLAADPAGSVLIAQTGSFSIRKIVFDPIVNTPTAAASTTPTRTPTQASTATFTWTSTPTRTGTTTPTPTNTPADTPTSTATRSATPTSTSSPTSSPTATATPTATPTSSQTSTRTPTSTPTQTSTRTPTRTPTSTFTQTPTRTPTRTPTSTYTRTNTPTRSPTRTPTSTLTRTPTRTPTFTSTGTSTRTPTRTPTSTSTQTPSRTPTLGATATATRTMTSTPTVSTSTPTRSPSVTSTITPTRTSTHTSTSTPTRSPTAGTTPTTSLGAVSGQIVAAGNNTPIVSALVELEPAGGQTQTVAGGNYSFSGLSQQTWTIKPSLLGLHGGAIDMDDVQLALDAAVGAATLTMEERLAADVTGNGDVTSTDASLIWQFIGGIISTFPVAENCDSDWAFLPDASMTSGQQLNPPVITAETCAPGTIVLDPLTGTVVDRNFRGVLFGDVNGSWPAGGTP